MIHRADKVLDRILSRYKLDAEQGEFLNLLRDWENLVGPEAAEHTRVCDLLPASPGEGGILKIRSDHPGWIQMLKLQEEKILKNIQAKFPNLNVRGLRIFVG
ncbi:MAG: DUF721 domain-containing protein [Spirochaetales bacterium]|jgi:predicted nucleic acid-binding Zn ribbon protein|nr:DUF721 domain-containing protein [Spirochaetales bacterium]